MAGLPAKDGVGAGPGGEAAHATGDFFRRAIPVDAAVLFFQHWGVSGSGVILRTGDDRTRGQAAQSFSHEWSVDFREAGGEFGRGFSRTNRDFALQQHVASVHAGVNAHGGHTGSRLTVDNGPVDGSGAPVFWEQGSVEVDPAEPGDGQKARRDNLAVRYDDNSIGRQILE